MKALRLMVIKLCADLKFSKCRSKDTVKVTCSKYICYQRKGLFIRNTHAKYESPDRQADGQTDDGLSDP